jgi:hypothetical protein
VFDAPYTLQENRMTSFVRRLCLTAALSLTISSLAHAQAPRTWVSGVGDDVNPCSRTAPCKTFAGAISKTAAGGEISVLDPGGFGAVTITKAITINGDGTLAGILASNTNGIIVNAGPNDAIVIRNVSVHGGGTGLNGIRFIAGGSLVVEHCTFTGFLQNNIDIAINTGNPANITVRDTTIIGLATSALSSGVAVNNAGIGRVAVDLTNVSIKRTVNAVHTLVGFTNVTNSVITQNSSFGLLAENTSNLTAIRNTLTNNGTAAQAGTGATVRLSDNDVYDNLTGFGCGGGTLASAVNNRKFNNVGGGAACAPTVTINTQ